MITPRDDLIREALRRDHLADQRFARSVERLIALGARGVSELFAEIAAERLIRTLIETKLDDYIHRLEAVDPEILTVLGGDRFPSRLFAVPEL
jgi:hypothetical protein